VEQLEINGKTLLQRKSTTAKKSAKALLSLINALQTMMTLITPMVTWLHCRTLQ